MWIRPNNESINEYLIDNLTVADMNETKWQYRDVTFNVTSSDYTVRSSLLKFFVKK